MVNNTDHVVPDAAKIRCPSPPHYSMAEPMARSHVRGGQLIKVE